MIHTKIGPALRDWTTWLAVTLGGALASLSPLVDEPWSRYAQIAAIVIGLVGTLVKGPQGKISEDSGHADAA